MMFMTSLTIEFCTPLLICLPKAFHDGSAKVTTEDFECMVRLKKCTLQKVKKNKKIKIMFISNANPLHYYALRVPRKVDRWRYVWSIFDSRTAWADHITCGLSICIVVLEKVQVRVTV